MAQEDSPSKLAELACGKLAGASSSLSHTLGHLSSTLDALLRELPTPYGNHDEVQPLFVPFLVRGILEVTCTALIARTDPFRVLALREIQSSSNYEVGRRVACAIQWQGDVVADKAPEWNADMKPDKLARALLSDHQDQILWRPAFLRFLDALGELQAVGRWSQELKSTTPEGFVPRFRGEAQHTYSAASKGIHQEFLLPFNAYTDKSSLDVLVETGIKTAAGLSVVANFCDHVTFGVPPTEAVLMYEALQ